MFECLIVRRGKDIRLYFALVIENVGYFFHLIFVDVVVVVDVYRCFCLPPFSLVFYAELYIRPLKLYNIER